MQTIYVLNEATMRPEAILEEVGTCEWSERYFVDGVIKVTMPDKIAQLRSVRKGKFLLIDGLVYRVDQVQAEHKKSGEGSVEVLGKTFGLLEDRSAIPPVGLDHDSVTNDPAETAIKHYVDVNLGPGASAERRWNDLVIAPDLGRGALVSYDARYQPVSEIVRELGEVASMGWRLTVDIDAGEFTFDVLIGEDHSLNVFFDVDFETALSTKLLSTDAGRKNFAIVAGQGEGAARTIVERWTGGAEPTGINRREMFVDARDLDAIDALEVRGDAKLAETDVPDTFSIEVNPTGSFRYGEHWGLGDLVTVRNTAWDVSEVARVVGVTRKASGGTRPDLSVEVGRPWPSIKDVVKTQTQQSSGGDFS